MVYGPRTYPRNQWQQVTHFIPTQPSLIWRQEVWAEIHPQKIHVLLLIPWRHASDQR